MPKTNTQKSSIKFDSLVIQSKLKLSHPNDAFEQEADRIAEQIMRMPDPRDSVISRKCSGCKMKDEEEEMKISRKADNSHDLQVSYDVAQQIDGIRGGGGQSLDDSTRNFMESRFGFDFSKVRIHTDERATRSAESVNARAYTVGNDIIFGKEHYNPNSDRGRILLAHELTHVIQQKQSGNTLYRKTSLNAPSTCSNKIGPCCCDESDMVKYDSETFRYLSSIKDLTLQVANSHNVSPIAIGGAIADEYNTQRGIKGVKDKFQDWLIGNMPESFIKVDRFFDFHKALLNTMYNDIGQANIKVRTAFELFKGGELSIPRVSPSEDKVRPIIDFLLTEQGMIETTAAVISKARKLLGPHIASYDLQLKESVEIEYFKQGDKFYSRFIDNLSKDPTHRVCPGDGGCSFLYNYNNIINSLR